MSTTAATGAAHFWRRNSATLATARESAWQEAGKLEKTWQRMFNHPRE